jgi:hypothetical protein
MCKIKLTTTTGYFNSVIPRGIWRNIFITNSSNIQFNFIENPCYRVYICSNFIPVINETYTLTVVNGGYLYRYRKIKISIPISEIVQNNEGGFYGKILKSKLIILIQQTKLITICTNTIIQTNKNYYADEDTFFQGNKFFQYFTK